MYLTQPLHKSLQEKPNAIALVCGGRRHSFAQLVARVARMASVLRARGLQPGDRVGYMALNSERYIEFLYATWWAGGIVNPINVRWNARETAYSLDDCDTRIVLFDEHYEKLVPELKGLSRSLDTCFFFGNGSSAGGLEDMEQALAAVGPVADALRQGDDLAAVMYTGGTTGLPKGVMLTHTNLFSSQLSTLSATERSSNAVGVNPAPLFHVGGAGLSIQLMLRLCKQVILPSFDEVPFMQAVQDERVTETFLVPTMLKRLIEHPRFTEFDLSSLLTIVYGAAPIDDALLVQAMNALPGVGFCQVYGMTELSPVIAALPQACHMPDQPAHRRRSAGRPVPIVEVCILNDEGVPAPCGQVGEIAARGPTVMQGYWGQPEQTAKALRNGWMHTGDGGYLDKDGYLYVVDRLKDMIVTGGENVYSAEVENAISQLPQVSMCAVVGVPDDRWGERVHAVVVLRAHQTLDEKTLTDHCRALISSYKCPRSVEFLDSIPLSPTGKILKYALRDRYWIGRDRRV